MGRDQAKMCQPQGEWLSDICNVEEVVYATRESVSGENLPSSSRMGPCIKDLLGSRNPLVEFNEDEKSCCCCCCCPSLLLILKEDPWTDRECQRGVKEDL